MNKNQENDGKKLNKTKETRWERIRKNHTKVTVTTDVVKKFFNLNYVNTNEMKIMNGDRVPQTLDPALVMQMRHNEIKRKSTKKTTVDPTLKTKPIDQLNKIHQNTSAEMKYLSNQIKQFKNGLNAPKESDYNPFVARLEMNPVDNRKLLESLKQGFDTVQDFYSNHSEISIEEADLFYVDEYNNHDFDLAQECTDHQGIYLSELWEDDDAADLEELFPDRCVRFESFVEIIQYTKDEGNTSQDCSITELNDDLIASNHDHDPEEDDFIDSPRSLLTVQITPKYEINNDQSLKLIGKPFHGENHIQISSRDIDSEISTDAEDTIISENTADSKDSDDLNDSKYFKDIKHCKDSADSSKDSTDQTASESNDDHLSSISEPKLHAEPLMVTKIVLSNHHHKEDQEEIFNNQLIEPYRSNSRTDLKARSHEITDEEKMLLQKYFLSWVYAIAMMKSSRKMVQRNPTRVQKFEAFLDSLSLNVIVKKKPKDGHSMDKVNSIIMAKKFQNKLKLQQDIIDMQKLKLQRQERIISDLKLNKLTEDTKESKAGIKKELKNVLRTGCINARIKARCLQVVGNLKDAEDDELKVQATTTPKFLLEMQTRAIERIHRHNEAKLRREQIDQDKEDMRLAAEEAKRLADDEAKRQRMRELRQKRILEKQQKAQRDAERIKRTENNKKADQFNRIRLLQTYGLVRFKRLVKLKRQNQRKAMAHSRLKLMRHAFRYWKDHVDRIWMDRKKNADECYRKQLLRMGLRHWIQYHKDLESKMLLAIDWYEIKLTEHVIHAWDLHTKEQIVIENAKMRTALTHYNWHLKWKAIDCWRRLQSILLMEKETEQRRQRWRMKIWELLPDYKPNCEQN